MEPDVVVCKRMAPRGSSTYMLSFQLVELFEKD